MLSRTLMQNLFFEKLDLPMIALRFYVVGVALSQLTPHHIKLRSLLTSRELVNSPLVFKMLVVLASLISLAGQAVAHYTFV